MGCEATPGDGKGEGTIISKREWVAALRRVMKGVALMVGGASLMAAVVYLSIGLVAEAAFIAVMSAATLGYGVL